MVNLITLLGEKYTAEGIKELIEEKIAQYGDFYVLADDIQAEEFIYKGITYTMVNRNEIEFNFELIDKYEGWQSHIEITRVEINENNNLK